VSGEEQSSLVERQLDAVGARIEAIILEPEGRNTAAAAAVAAAWLIQDASDELMLLVPSDHVVGDLDAFLAAIEKGMPHAEQGAIVTFGVQPTEPNTQYGYIEVAADAPSSDGAVPIARFVEKPDAGKAAEYFHSGRFFWNAGIFLVKASTLLAEMHRYLAASAETITRAVAAAHREGQFVRPDGEAFAAAQDISIDHGIMEKTSLGMVVPVSMRWSDVGSWDAVWKLGEKDERGNVLLGDVVALDTRASLIRNEGGPLIAAIGLDGIAVIAVEDAMLIAPLNRASEVKELVDKLRAEGRQCVTSPPNDRKGQ
jgi:mannose-1-phosphate guanylyltransferase/mannose-1-phosphate guanylyltransferase/mannose-6-phosphate isomerase